ncbi:hypothetical protein [Synechocystis sp. CS-94]|nr:hypothetical protein [Synechocystis sp. CS-94]MCT0253330.1 hypothetical protein [Synechocystis sp. CS-94]
MFKQKQEEKIKEAAGFAVGGGALGAGLAAFVGNMGLAGGFGAIAVGAAPVIGAGVVTGLAAYGVKKILD